LQAGNFGENRFDSVSISTEDGLVQKIEIDNKWFTLELGAGAGAVLDFQYTQYVNQPTYETPYSARSSWDSLNPSQTQ
jgi:hypothetical protein